MSDQDKFIIANPRHVPLYRYDSKHDNTEDGWIEYHSRKYLRRQRKLIRRKNAAKSLIA